MAPQHADQHGMDLLKEAHPGPALQGTAPGRAFP
jgi:hypothetical protein